LKLRSIFLKGFKSFAKPTLLNLSEGITAIVGPNGSGKSNIIDAIRWVFGEHSMKQLRAGEKFDVLFAGSEKFPPANSAYVELSFEDNGEILKIARELSRDGRNNYYINGSPVRLKDIKDKFKGTGIGMDFYSIVPQGQVERIVNASPEELRFLLEEAAGTSFYREKKRAALVKLEHTENNLNRVGDILFEKERMKKSLYLKAKRAERYIEYSEKLKKLKKIFYGNLFVREKRRLDHLNEEKTRTSQKYREIQKELVNLESRWSTLRMEFSKIDEELESFTKLLEDHKKRQNTLLELKEVYDRRLSERESKYVEVTTRMDSLTKEKEELEKRKGEIDYIFKGLITEIEEKEALLKKYEKQREEIVSRYSEREKEFVRMKDEYDSLEKKYIKLEMEVSKIDDMMEDMEKRRKMVESQLDLKRNDLEGKKKEFEDLVRRMEEMGSEERNLVEELKEVRKQLGELEMKKRDIVEKRDSILKSIKELEMEKDIIERNLREYRDFSKAVKEVFRVRDMFPGLEDVVTNIIEVNSENALAIGVLLGGNAQNIVVRDVETAKEIIDYLKKNEIGRVTILPLDLIESREPGIDGVENHPGFVGYASNMVKVPPGFEKLPGYLFGNDIVVKTLDDAIDIKIKYGVRSRVVSLDGQMVHGRGAISGGSTKSEEIRTPFKRKIRLEEIKKELSKLSQDLNRMEEDLASLDTEIETLTKQEKIVERELSELSLKVANVKRTREDLARSIERMEGEVEELEKLKKEYHMKLEGMKARREKALEDMENIYKTRKELENKMKEFSEVLNKEKKVLDELSEKILDLKLEVGNLREKSKRYEEELENIRKRKDRIDEEMENLSKESEDLEKEIERLKRMIRENQKELETLKKETDELFENLRYRKTGKEEKLKEMEELENRMGKLKEEAENLREYLHHIDLSLQESEMKLSNILKELEEEPQEVEEVDQVTLESIEKEIKDLENRIKYLGPVDLEAVDEYKKVEEEYEDLLKQKEDLEEAKKKLLEIIEKTDREARSIFMDVYQKVNENFGRFVSLLFFGAEGEIRILPSEDILEAGFEISIRKPGRKAQKLQLLSGGEKALIGIAFLFALLQVKPSPFYVLDEVDAPLDDFNAERYKKLLKEYSKKSQFLIITHNKIVMEVADMLHGVTLVDGISTVIPVELEKMMEVKT